MIRLPIKLQTKLSFGKLTLSTWQRDLTISFSVIVVSRRETNASVFGFFNLMETAQFHADNRNKPAKERERERGKGRGFQLSDTNCSQHVSIRPTNLISAAKRFSLKKFAIAEEFVEVIQMILIIS